MRKLIQLNLRYLFIAVLAIITFAASAEIKLNSNDRMLEAPEGSDYQWLYNGIVQMGSNDQQISAKESGTYTIEYRDLDGVLQSEEVTVAVTAQTVRKVFIISDSIAANYNGSFYPQKGWGQVLQLYFDEAKIAVNNKARGGRSSRSYYEEGLWTSVLSEVSEGDFVFIQFGANDRNVSHPTRGATPDVYKGFLRTYINDTRAKNAIPVLLSPILLAGTRNVYTESGSDYRGAMEEVANELDVLFIDVNKISEAFNVENSGGYTNKFIYLGLDPGEYPNYPDGINDFTHIQEMGAYQVCQMISDGLKAQAGHSEADILIDAIKPTYKLEIERGSTRSGLVTLSGEYPAGVNITLKAQIEKGFKWLHWEDENNQIVTTDQRTTFTMEAKDYKFTAAIEDCAGVVGGSGFIDNCNTCIDGVVVTSGCTYSIQGDRACKWEGETYSEDIDGLTANFASVGSFAGDTITYVVRALEAGNYNLGIKYRQGVPDLVAQVYVNGKLQIKELSIPEAGDDFLSTIFNVDLELHNNHITLVFPTMSRKLDISIFATYSRDVRVGSTCQDVELEDPLGIYEYSQISVYPNPFTNGATLSSIDLVNYKILDLSGILLEEGKCMYDCQIGENLKTGTYILELKTTRGRASSLIIKE